MSELNDMRLIRGRQLLRNEWMVFELAEGDTPESVAVPPAPTFTMFPLAVWKARKHELLARHAKHVCPLGVWLGPTDEPTDLAADIDLFDVIGICFPKFTDGRGYSTATLIRQRLGFKGELRAFGDIGRDQLFNLSRVGFDSFLIPKERNAIDALRGFDDFPETYQTATDQSLPLFRRRTA